MSGIFVDAFMMHEFFFPSPCLLFVFFSFHRGFVARILFVSIAWGGSFPIFISFLMVVGSGTLYRCLLHCISFYLFSHVLKWSCGLWSLVFFMLGLLQLIRWWGREGFIY